MTGQPEQAIRNALMMLHDGHFSLVATGKAAREANAALDALAARLRQAEQALEAADHVAEVWSRKVLEAGVGTGDVWAKYQEARAAYDAAKEQGR